MTLPKTGGPEWTAAQASPQVPVNEALRRLDANVSRAIVVDRDLTAPPGSCADGANYLVAASATGDWAGQDGKMATAFGTNASNGWKFQTVAVEGFRIRLQDEDIEIEYNGSSWVSVGGVSIRPIAFFFTTAPESLETLLLYTAVENITLADDFAGSAGDVGSNPAGSFVLDVKKNGSSVGSVTISTGGSFTFVTSGAAVSLAAGDQLSVLGPGAPDASIADVSITFKGTL